ncbi:hypothetical protein C1H46_026372 [Malus baccata]|uniref:Uncharacterized protein n=1 Tax=Malus baccata TaxID=106549 RepID=A0A540LNL1_MALBA|nr:hypothetical protein C1H46_026372 [Malus baccata]
MEGVLATENRFKTTPLAGTRASEGDPEPEEGMVVGEAVVSIVVVSLEEPIRVTCNGHSAPRKSETWASVQFDLPVTMMVLSLKSARRGRAARAIRARQLFFFLRLGGLGKHWGRELSGKVSEGIRWEFG